MGFITMIGYRLEELNKSEGGEIGYAKWMKFYIYNFRLTVENNRAHQAIEKLLSSPPHMSIITLNFLPNQNVYIANVNQQPLQDLLRAGIIDSDDTLFTFSNEIMRYLCLNAAVSSIGKLYI